MNQRKGMVGTITLAAVLSLTAALPILEAKGEPKLPEGWTFSFPEGDPQDGKIDCRLHISPSRSSRRTRW